MNLIFFATTLTMLLVALSFAATPLIMSYQRQNAGFAKLPLLVVIVVIGLAIVMYAVLGRPGVSGHPSSAANNASMTQTASPAAQKEKVASVDALLAGLEQRLQDQPDDGKGWLLLAKSYDHLGREADAAAAYAKAAALGITDDAFQARLDGASGTVTSAGAAGSDIEIRGRISVDSAVAAEVDPDDVVFISAKAANSPMPLAVLRRSAAELPIEFVLSDANSMVKGSGLSGAGEVVVTAKISKSGDALNTPDGLQATSQPFEPQTAGFIELTIGSTTHNAPTQ